tara:strand:- start:50 stop:1045 length:996 start_codon:yes stop_codon:yes gene_type:complete
MNILFTSIGRRHYLVDFLRKHLNSNDKIISINSKNTSSAKNNSNYFYLSPEVKTKKYIEFVKSVIKKHKIKVIIPLLDIDVKKLSENFDVFKKLNVTLIAPPQNITKILVDKYKLFNFLTKNKIDCPKSYIFKKEFFKDLKLNKIKYPVILKPRLGTSSKLIVKANNKKELLFFYKFLTKEANKSFFGKKNDKQSILIQQYIQGKEFGLDLFNSIKKEYFFHLLKEKIFISSGETQVCKVSSNNISILSKKISKLISHNFLVDIDLIKKGKKFYIIDINPRIGGGYPFTHFAGCDMFKYLISQIYNKKYRLKFNINTKNIFVKNIQVTKIK